MEEPRWTLDELVERVDAALAVDYHGQPSGRVRDVPDRRAIRWYTTIGLIDRPVAHRGRAALYGPRHLLQLVAVKRLQARGLPLVAIQQELAGATDAQLARVARLPAATPSLERPAAARPGTAAAAKAPATASPTAAAALAAGPARRAGFWRERPAGAGTAGAHERVGAVDPAGAPDPAGATDPLPVSALRGVRLGEGATLLLEPGRELGAADLRAILDAARPLLAALRARGLAGPPGPAPRPRPPGRPDLRREHP